MLFRGFLAIAGLIAAVLLARWFEERERLSRVLGDPQLAQTAVSFG